MLTCVVVSTLAERLKLLVSLVDDLSLRELARLIDVSESYPALIASGDRPKIRSDIAVAIARLFDTTLDFVVSGEGEPPTKDVATAAVARARIVYEEKEAAKKAAREAKAPEYEAPAESERTPTPGSKAAAS